jgi:sortase (surface protein transpeptidase)
MIEEEVGQLGGEVDLIQMILDKYGVSGGLAVAIYWLYHKQQKRMRELEERNDENADKQVEAYKDLVHEYTELVQKNTSVIGSLTGCITSIKEAIERLERKS